MTASNTVFAVFSGIGVILSVIPLWWHLGSPNTVATCMYMIWTAIACLIYFVDSIVWSGNAINWAPVWCDIAIRLQIGASVAWPACALCIIRRIYNITASSIPAAVRREAIIELLLTIGLPVLGMVMEYMVAGHRFNIYEDYGCSPATWNTPLAYVLVWSWPLIIAVISACYGALALYAFVRRRKEFRDLNLACNNYYRLTALASIDFFATIPLAIYHIFLNVEWNVVSPWVSWDDTHWGYSRVFQFPRTRMSPIEIRALEINRWVAVFCAFMFFGFFGFSGEATKTYRLLASAILKPFGCTLPAEGATTPGQRVDLPSLHFATHASNTQQNETKMDSDSLSDTLSTSIVINEDDLDSLTKQSTQPTSSGPSVEKAPQVPEPTLGPSFVWRGSVSDAPKDHPTDPLDRV